MLYNVINATYGRIEKLISENITEIKNKICNTSKYTSTSDAPRLRTSSRTYFGY